MEKSYQVIVYEADGTTTDFTITDAQLASAPVVGGQNVDIRRGRVETRPWKVEVIDASDFVSSQIADAGGRMILIGRLIRCQVKVDGGAWVTLATGRITNIALGSSVVDFVFTVQDERWIERNTEIWTDCARDDDWPSTGAEQKAGTTLIPPGIDGVYGDFVGYRYTTVQRWGEVLYKSGNVAVVGLDRFQPEVGALMGWFNPAQTISMLEEDIKAEPPFELSGSAGNFETLRCRVNGTLREVYALGNTASLYLTFVHTTEELKAYIQALLVSEGEPLDILVAVFWSGASAGDAVTSAHLAMPGHEPTEHMPLHIGGEAIKPFEVVRKLYDDAGVRYSTSAMDSLEDDPLFPPARFRITSQENMATWLEENIYQPYGVVPFINSSGHITPQKVYLPQNVASTSLYEFTSTNASEPHPTWDLVGRDMVRRMDFTYKAEELAAELRDAPADAIDVNDVTLIEKHDRQQSTSTLQTAKLMKVKLHGYHHRGVTTRIPFSTITLRVPGAEDVAESLADEIFDRFGDGPIRGTITGLSPTESVEPGDFVRITLPTFPDPENQTRGGTRIVQILSRVDAPAGPEFEWLDAGPNQQALTAPTLSLAKSTVDGYNTIVLTVSNLSTSTGNYWQAQTAVGASEPSSTSGKWTYAKSGVSTGDYSVLGYPSGQTVWGHIRQAAVGRIRSAWSTGVSSTLTALTAPSSISVANSSGQFAELNITLGSTDRDIEILHSESTSCTSTRSRVATLPMGTTVYDITGLTKGSTNCAAARHVDDYGGRSAVTTVSFSLSTSNPQAPPLPLGAFTLLQGSS